MNGPKVTHTGEIEIGNLKIPCAVLEDGTRVLSENGITNALLGSRSGYSKRRTIASKAKGAPLPLFLAPERLKPFISKELVDGPLTPLNYIQNSRRVTGFVAEVLPGICDVWLQARDAGALQTQQLDKAKKAEILMRGLAHIGIIALVDEATGYQKRFETVSHCEPFSTSFLAPNTPSGPNGFLMSSTRKSSDSKAGSGKG